MGRRAFAGRLLALGLGLGLGSGCSRLTARYQQPGYQVAGARAVKHVTLQTWAPEGTPGLAPVMAQVAADFIKLRKNYVLTDAQSAPGLPTCAQGSEGLLLLRVADARADKRCGLHGTLELYRCGDGALLFRSEATVSTRSDEPSLKDLTSTYAAQLGDAGARWAAPAFGLTQVLAEPLPNPVLSDAEIEEKIELGARDHLEAVPTVAQLGKGGPRVSGAEMAHQGGVVGL